MNIVPTTKSRKHEDGIASVIMLLLLGLVFGFIIANMNTLSGLHNDVKRIEQRQIRRINPVTPPASTNSIGAETISK